MIERDRRSTGMTSKTMLFAVIAHDRPDGLEQRISQRVDHFNYLHSLGDKDVFAGALFANADKMDGSLIRVRFRGSHK